MPLCLGQYLVQVNHFQKLDIERKGRDKHAFNHSSRVSGFERLKNQAKYKLNFGNASLLNHCTIFMEI